MKNKDTTFMKDYYCTVTISFHHIVPKGTPSMVSILHAAAYILLCCLANRSTDSGIPKTDVDYMYFRYKDPDPL